MDTPHDPPRADALCPSCGALLPADASFCVVCGRPTAPAETVEVPAPVAEMPTGTPAQTAPVQDAAAPAEVTAADIASSGSLRVCDWCGAANPATAERCEKCGASFPRPEQDNLLARASAERVRLALSEIEMHERLRAPWWRRLFGGKTT